MRNTITQTIRAFALFSFLILLSATTFAQVGIGNTDPTTMLDVSGAMSLREGATIPLTSGNVNLTAAQLGTTPFSQYRLTATGPFTIRNITPLTLANGQILTLINESNFDMTLAHDVSGTAARRIYCPGETNLVLPGKYASVTLQYNASDARWIVVNYGENAPNSSSISIASDILISGSTYSNIAGTDLTFTAKKSSVLVLLTASGFGYTNSMSYVQLRVRSVTPNIVLGGTNTKIQSYDDVTGTITSWSASFSKLFTGLTVGNTYTLRVQGLVNGILGLYDAAIWPISNPDSQHLTLSVIQ